MTIHFYLDENGYEITEPEFREQVEFWGHGVILYVGGGFVPLVVAMPTDNATNWSDPVAAFEDWARRNDRLDEIGEDDPESEYFGEYSLHVEKWNGR